MFAKRITLLKSYIHGQVGPSNVRTISEKVIEYNGIQILIQVNEFDSNLTNSRRKEIDVYELIGPLHAYSTDFIPYLSKVNLIKNRKNSLRDRDVLERIITSDKKGGLDYIRQFDLR